MSTPALPQVIEISPTATQARVAAGALLVDVREADELREAAFDVPELLHVPLSAFETRYHEIPKDRDVVVACRGGARSLKATHFLVVNGYDRVESMAGGIMRWQTEGLPLRGTRPAARSVP